MSEKVLTTEAEYEETLAYVATLIQGRTPEEIREIFVLPRDMTTEEARARAAELAWAVK